VNLAKFHKPQSARFKFDCEPLNFLPTSPPLDFPFSVHLPFRWRIPSFDYSELVDRFKNLGVCASRAGVTAALAEVALELEISGRAPWRLLERGTEWILEPKSELVALLSGVRQLL
jgi:hypothetical protein